MAGKDEDEPTLVSALLCPHPGHSTFHTIPYNTSLTSIGFSFYSTLLMSLFHSLKVSASTGNKTLPDPLFDPAFAKAQAVQTATQKSKEQIVAYTTNLKN